MSLWNQMLELQCPYEKVRWSRVTFQNNSSDTRHQRLLVTNINPANLWCQPTITNTIINSKRYLNVFLRFTLFPKFTLCLYLQMCTNLLIYLWFRISLENDVNAVLMSCQQFHAYKWWWNETTVYQKGSSFPTKHFVNDNKNTSL